MYIDPTIMDISHLLVELTPKDIPKYCQTNVFLGGGYVILTYNLDHTYTISCHTCESLGDVNMIHWGHNQTISL